MCVSSIARTSSCFKIKYKFNFYIYLNYFYLDQLACIVRVETDMANRVLHFFRSTPLPRKHDAVSDEELVAAIQQGDGNAWAQFLERYTDLIYTKAWDYSQTEKTARDPEAREDETSELYLFLCEYLRRSLKSFRGHCQPRTWVVAIIKNRGRVLKTYLMHKDPQRADARLPVILNEPSREMLDGLSEREHKIFSELSREMRAQVFKQLVWGMTPAYIAQGLNISEGLCLDLEDLLRRHSPRTFERIWQNRLAQASEMRIDALEEDEDRPTLELIDPGPAPDEAMEMREYRRAIQSALHEGLASLSTTERRVLILLYNKNIKPGQIVRLAAEPDLHLEGIENEQQVYYLRRKAMEKLLDHLLESGEIPVAGPQSAADKKELTKLLEELLQEQGVLVEQAQ